MTPQSLPNSFLDFLTPVLHHQFYAFKIGALIKPDLNFINGTDVFFYFIYGFLKWGQNWLRWMLQVVDHHESEHLVSLHLTFQSVALGL
jgi:hypothetical protein